MSKTSIMDVALIAGIGAGIYLLIRAGKGFYDTTVAPITDVLGSPSGVVPVISTPDFGGWNLGGFPIGPGVPIAGAGIVTDMAGRAAGMASSAAVAGSDLIGAIGGYIGGWTSSLFPSSSPAYVNPQLGPTSAELFAGMGQAHGSLTQAQMWAAIGASPTTYTANTTTLSAGGTTHSAGDSGNVTMAIASSGVGSAGRTPAPPPPPPPPPANTTAAQLFDSIGAR